MEASTPSNDAPSPTSRTATGKMLVDIAGYNDLNYDLALQPDGKILLAGQSYNPDNATNDFSVIRLNADGTLDTGFGSDGKAIFQPGYSNDQGHSVTIMPDGKILMAGSSYDYSENSTDFDFSVIRLDADGSLDTSFGSGGKAIFDLGRGDYVYSMAMQPDGKILVTGRSDNGSHDNLGVIRLNADGTLDTGFGSDGKAIFQLGYSDDQGHSVAIMPDGKFLMAGSSYDYSENSTYFDFSVIRLNADGSFDTGFGSGGEATADIDGNNDFGNSLLVQPDGKILVAGRSYNPSYDTEFSVARLNADGSLDASFGSDGKASFALGKGYAQVNSLALQADGKILLAGQSYNPDNATYDFTVIRLNVDGSLDTGFSGDGKSIFDIAWGNDEGHGLTVLPDGKILVSGSSYNPSNAAHDFSVIRLNADGTLDKTFGALPEDLLLTLEGNHDNNDNNDVLIGSDAYERLLGKSGNDVLDGGAGRDSLSGGTGADLFRVSARDDSYRTDSEGFSDRILDFDPGQDRIDLSALGFTGLGDGHDGTLAVQVNSAGTLTYLKSFEADAEERRFEISLKGNLAGLLDNNHLMFEPLVLEGTEAGDNLQSSPVAEILAGHGGADYLDGAGGGDLLDGGAGRDTLSGGGGADVFRFSAREDSYRTDSESFSDRILDFDPGQDRIDLSALGFTGLGDGHDGTLAVRVNSAGTRTYLKSFEADAEGQRFEIVLDGDLADRLDSGNVLFAPVAIEGTEDSDSLLGSPVAEILAGHGGADSLHGAGGDDVLIGGAGRDKLTGGGGADLFRFSAREDSYRTDSEGFSDRILDFDAGQDRIDLSALGFTSLGDGHDGTLAVQVNDAGTLTYLKSFEADAEGRRFEIALQGDYVDQLSADAFLFAAAGNSTGQLQIIGATQIEQVS